MLSTRGCFRILGELLIKKVPYRILEVMLTCGILEEGRPSFLPAAVIKYPDTKHLRENGFISAPNSRLEYIIASDQNGQSLKQFVSPIVNREEMNECMPLTAQLVLVKSRRE